MGRRAQRSWRLWTLEQQLAESEKARGTLEEKVKELEAENRELRLQQRAVSAKSQGMTWEYEAGQQCWCSMSAEASQQLVAHYRAFLEPGGSSSVQLDQVQGVYNVDFEAMTQSNALTGTQRRIRLKSDAPPCWSTSLRELLRERNLAQLMVQEWSTAIRQRVPELLRGSSHGPQGSSMCHLMQNARILSLWRIENYMLWRRYMDQCKHMADSKASPDSLRPLLGSNSDAMKDAAAALTAHFGLGNGANEVWLFHGSTRSKIEQIAQLGFDSRVANRGLYGEGIYFASEACKSHQYTCVYCNPGAACSCPGPRYMILARVALGSPHYTTKVCRELRRPPPRQDVAQARLHDCVVANPGTMEGHQHGQQAHQEFVLFEGAQAYPCFVVIYQV